MDKAISSGFNPQYCIQLAMLGRVEQGIVFDTKRSNGGNEGWSMEDYHSSVLATTGSK